MPLGKISPTNLKKERSFCVQDWKLGRGEQQGAGVVTKFLASLTPSWVLCSAVAISAIF